MAKKLRKMSELNPPLKGNVWTLSWSRGSSIQLKNQNQTWIILAKQSLDKSNNNNNRNNR